MTQIQWHTVGSNVYEAGVDRGVLYVGNDAGVPWNGLVAVSESSGGGAAKPYYLDGIKFANRAAAVEFTATIEAYTYPDEFAECDGTVQIRNGLFARNQRRKSFSLAYRTKVGDDVDGIDLGYKIHLIYNALAAPSNEAHQSLNDQLAPMNFSWTVTTKPASLSGYKPTPHLVIDSRVTPSIVLTQIEDILYGNATKDSRLPSIGELAFLFQVYQTSFIDGGDVTLSVYGTIDAGDISTQLTSTYDGGTP